MIKSQTGLFKLLRNRYHPFYTKVTDFFKELNTAQQKNTEQVFDKKKFMEQLKKEREEYDKEFEERRAAYEFADKQQIRQMNITLAKFDYQKVALQNINIIPKESFAYPSEIFYFLKQANTQLTVDNIVLCVRGMLYCYQQDQDIDIESEEFQSLVSIVEQGILLTQDIKTLSLFSQFGDCFTIAEEQFWVNLQAQTIQNISNQPTEIVLPIFINFANQKEGSEEFYQKMESYFQSQINSFSTAQQCQLLFGFYKMGLGSHELIMQLFKIIVENLDDLDKNHLIYILECYSKIQEVDGSVFNKIENHVWKVIKDLSLQDICIICSSFGDAHGSPTLFKQTQHKIVEFIKQNTDQIDLNQLINILNGFIYNLRAESELLETLKPLIIVFNSQLSISDRAKIIKAYNIMEADDTNLYQQIEQSILVELKDVDNVSLDEFVEVVKSYTVTRIGSREIYKVMDFWIQFRWDDVIMDRELATEIYSYFYESGLISTKTISGLRKFV